MRLSAKGNCTRTVSYFYCCLGQFIFGWITYGSLQCYFFSFFSNKIMVQLLRYLYLKKIKFSFYRENPRILVSPRKKVLLQKCLLCLQSWSIQENGHLYPDSSSCMSEWWCLMINNVMCCWYARREAYIFLLFNHSSLLLNLFLYCALSWIKIAEYKQSEPVGVQWYILIQNKASFFTTQLFVKIILSWRT